jgi:endogenous inhibitor of DNA gyrase (YacG/DUF329 family)
MSTCPECHKELPWGEAFRSESGAGLPDRRELDCPYCGAPLERIRWKSLVPIFAIVAVSIAARVLIGPLLDWKTILLLLGLAAIYHLVELRNLRKARREEKSRRRRR